MPFNRVVGHGRIIEVLRRTLRFGKTSHSYIFEGPEGCGRKTVALELIQALFCSKVADDSCGVCPTCLKVAGGNHADIHLIQPDGQFIKIEQVRELQRELAFRPYEAPRKACIIEQAERFNIAAANSLLKTLEEPPGNAIIILLTENAGMLLPTVRSRCQLISFSALAPEQVQVLLERDGMSADTARLIAPLAGGSMAIARSLDNDTLSAKRDTLLKRLAELDLHRISTIFDASEELGGNRDETLETIDVLLSCARDVLYTAAGCNQIVNEAVRPAIESLAARFPLPSAVQMIDEIREVRRAVQRNANSKLALDRLFMRIAGAA